MPDLPLGSGRQWSRDFGLLGLLSALLVPVSAVVFVARGGRLLAYAMDQMSAYFAVAAILGLATGLAFGPLLRALLLRFLRAPFGVLLIAVPLAAAAWGALVAWLAVPMGLARPAAGDHSYAAILGAIAAAIQVGWFWPLYVRSRVRERSPAPLLIAAVVAAMAIGPFALWSVTARL